MDRLTTANGVYGSLTFSYDAVGNRIGSEYTYDQPTQRLLARTAGGVTTTFAYDANGSLKTQTVGGNTTTFAYTPDGMVATVTAGGASTAYQYDGDLLRTMKTGAGRTVYTIHDGGGRLLSTFVEQSGALRWERDDLYLGGQLLAALRPLVGALPLTVTTAGTGGGTVTSVPAGILCGAGGRDDAHGLPPRGDDLHGDLRAGPAADGDQDGGREQRAGDHQRAARIVCAGACTVATGAFDAGTEVQLATNMLPAGFAFLGWTRDGCVNGPGPGEARVLMDRERACTATSRLVAAKQAPATGTSWLPADLTLSWSGAAPEVGFWVCVDQTNNHTCDTLWRPNGGATTMELGWMGLGAGTYYWQVRADTALGLFELDEGAWWSFTVGAPAGATFGKTAPANGAGGLGSAVTLTWAALSGAPGYEVCWDTTLNSTCDGTWQAAGTATSWALTNLTPGTYEWQVRAGGTTQADGGTWWTVTVPVLRNKLTPAKGTTGLTSDVWLSWTAVPNAGYWYCVDTVDNGQCDSMWWPNGGATTMGLGWMGLGPGTYYW